MSVIASNKTMTQEQFTNVLSHVVTGEKFFHGFSVNGKKTMGLWKDPREFYKVVTQALAQENFDKLYECRFGKSGKNTTTPFFVEGAAAPQDFIKGCCGDIIRYIYDQKVWHVDPHGTKYFVSVNLMHTVLFDQLWYYADHMGVNLEIECDF